MNIWTKKNFLTVTRVSKNIRMKPVKTYTINVIK